MEGLSYRTIKPGISRRFIFLALIMSGLYLALILLAVINHFYLAWLIAPALLVCLLAIVSIDRFFLLLLFLTPLSIQLRFLIPSTPIDIFLPTELMLAFLLLLILFKLVISKEFDRKNLRHPVTMVIALSLLWMVVTVFTGTNIVVSLKSFLVRLWYVAAFYLLSLELFRKEGFIEKSLKALIFGIVPVVIYHLVRLAGEGLINQQAAHVSMWPFFNDHTSFGAALAFLIPAVIYLMVTARNIWGRYLYAIIGVLFTAGFVFSYSRAAWLSLLLSGLFAMVYIFRIPWKLVWIIALFGGIIFSVSWSSIIVNLENNSQDSSANFSEHVRSISNITTDASNLERINRWKSALRMVKEKPLTGWGPGTYQFEYAPYQFSKERTIISTNFGDGGNAHSEYLGLMAESGIPATIIYLIILVAAFGTGHRVWERDKGAGDSLLVLLLMTGLFTYVIHGGLNNFLDTDKISAPFWIFIAALVSGDVKRESDSTPIFES